jgi:hypothetical protein
MDITAALKIVGGTVTADKQLFTSPDLFYVPTARCEVSERAAHCSSPHGPCEPSARLTGQVRTYATDHPKRVSTLLEAASERDQRSPHIHIVSPAIRARSCTIVTRMRPIPQDPGLSTPSHNVILRIRTSRKWRSPYHTDCVCHYSASSNRIQPVPSHGV